MTHPKKAIVIGGGLGGLSASINLRLRGWDVTLLEANDELGGRAGRLVRQGFHFDLGPSLLNYPWVFEQLFASAGRRLSDELTLLRVDPSVSFLWPDGRRFSLSSDLPRLLAECEGLAPGSSGAMVRFLRDASRKYAMAFNTLVTRNADHPLPWLWSVGPRNLRHLCVWRSLDAELRRYFQSRWIREALGSYAMYLGGSPFQLPGFFSILPFGELAYGLWLPRGGIFALVDAMARLANAQGVNVRTGCRVRQVAVAEDRVQGVWLTSGEKLDAAVVVSGVDVPSTDAQLLEANAANADRVGRVARTRMTPSVVTFYWGLRGSVPGLPHHTIFLPEDYQRTFAELFDTPRVSDAPAFYVSVPSATDPALAPPGHTTMFVLVPVPLVSQVPNADWNAIVAKLRGSVLSRLALHGWSIERSQFVYEEVLTPDDWQGRLALHDGSAFGASHTLFQLGPWRARNKHEHITGMFYTGASTTPGTGMPMVVLSGRLTAERVDQHWREQAA